MAQPEPVDLDAALDAVVASGHPRRGPECSVGAVLSILPADTAAKLVHVLTVPKPDGMMVATTTLSEILAAAGHQVKPDALQRHRRTMLGKQNGCACGVER
jgi:hypothetical protein